MSGFFKYIIWYSVVVKSSKEKHEARVVTMFCLRPIQPQPKFPEIQQLKRLVVMRGWHPPIIVSDIEQCNSLVRGEKRTAFEKKGSHIPC